MYVLFDSWYGGASLLNLLSKFGWQYVTRAKRNRLFEKVRFDKSFRHRFGRRAGNLRGIVHQILIVKDGKKYFLTNNLELGSAQVKRIYAVRQQIEEVFRLLKQEFGWGKCRAGSVQSQKAHLHLGLYAFVWFKIKRKKKSRRSMPTNRTYSGSKYQRKSSSCNALLLLRNIRS